MDGYNLNRAIQTLEAYYGNVPDGWVDAAMMALDDVDPGDLEQATRQAIKTLKWLPKISELREMAQHAKNERVSPVTNNQYYWMAIDEYNMRLRGEIDDARLETSKAWNRQVRRGIVEATA